MATCLGYREGTNCTQRSRSTQKRDNWQLWQLCYNCARILHPEYYKNKKNHGVRTVTRKTQYSKVPFNLVELPTVL